MADAPDWLTTDEVSSGPKPKPKPKPASATPSWLVGSSATAVQAPPANSTDWLTQPTSVDISDTSSDATSTATTGLASRLAAEPAAAPTPNDISAHAIAGLAGLLQHPNLSADQRVRIQTILSNQRKQFAAEQIPTPDSPLEQLKLSASSAALELPAAVAHLGAGLVSGANAKPTSIERFVAGIQPEVDPAHPTESALAQASGTAAGQIPSQIGAFEASKFLTGTAAGLAPDAIRTAARSVIDRAASTVGDALAGRIGQENAMAIAGAIKTMPLNAASGVTMQAMTDPKSLSTPQGVALALGMGALASLGDGKTVVELDKSAKAAAQAREVADAAQAGQTTLDPEVAKGQADIAERQALSDARRAAAKAWNALPPTLRSAMHPEAEPGEIVTNWKDLPKTTKEAIVARIRKGVDDANTIASQQAEAQPTGTEPASSPSGEPVPAQPAAQPEPTATTSQSTQSPPQGPPSSQAPDIAKVDESKVAGSIDLSPQIQAEFLSLRHLNQHLSNEEIMHDAATRVNKRYQDLTGQGLSHNDAVKSIDSDQTEYNVPVRTITAKVLSDPKVLAAYQKLKDYQRNTSMGQLFSATHEKYMSGQADLYRQLGNLIPRDKLFAIHTRVNNGEFSSSDDPQYHLSLAYDETKSPAEKMLDGLESTKQYLRDLISGAGDKEGYIGQFDSDAFDATESDILDKINNIKTPEDARALIDKIDEKIKSLNNKTGVFRTAAKRAANEVTGYQKTAEEKSVVGSIVPSDDVLREKLAEAIKLKSEEIHPKITELQNQLDDALRLKDQAERRASAAERDAMTDPLTGLQNSRALEQARPSMDADPNIHWIMVDMRNVHPQNEALGREATDRNIAKVAAVIKSVIPETDRVFRAGDKADEFPIGTSNPNPEILARAIENLVPDDVIPGTSYRTGVRTGVGNTFAEADAAVNAAKSAEVDRARPVTTQLTPPSEATSSEPAVKSRSFDDLAQIKSVDQLDKQIDKADGLFDNGKIDENTYTKRIIDIAARKQELKAAQINRAATQPTRAQMDKAATERMTVGQLRDAQSRLNGDMINAKPAEREAVTHDLFIVQRELRWRKAVGDLTDQSLEKHANELKDEWLDAQGQSGRQSRIEARMKEVDAEFIKRAKPNITDVLGNEKGFITLDRDPLEKAVDPSMPEYTKRILSKLKVGELDNHTMQGMSGMWSSIDEAYAHTVRSIHAFDKTDKLFGLQDMPTTKSIGKWAEMLSGSLGRAQGMLQKGSFSIGDDGELTFHGTRGPGETLAPFKGRINELRAYLVAQRTLRAAVDAKVTGIDVLDATRESNNAKPDIVKAAKDLTAFQNGVLQYAQESGALSSKALDLMVKFYDIYAPIDRWLDGKSTDQPVTVVGPKSKKGLTTSGVKETPIKKFVGGQTQIIDPLRQMVDRTRRLVTMADKQRLASIIVNAAESNPEMAKLIGISREGAGPRVIDPETAKKIEAIKAGAAANGLSLDDESAQQIAILGNSKRLKTRSDKMYYIRDGKLETWRIPPEIAAAWQGLSPKEMSFLVKMLAFPVQMAKTGITDNPAFGIVNMFRDSFDAGLQSKYGFKIGLDSIKGFVDAVTDNNYRKLYRDTAGISGGITTKATQSTDQALRSILPKTLGEKVVNVIKHPIDALRALSIPFEEAARLGEFVRARQAGAPAMDAALAAQRVTTNFGNRGLSTQALSQMVLFANPALQALDTFGRAVKSQPGRVMAAGLLGITLPSIYLWAANKDDDEIQEMRKSQYGDSYWYTRINGVVHKIPKPFIAGAIFGTGAEDALDKLYGQDPDGGKRFIQSLVQQLRFHIVPSALSLGLGVATGKDITTGSGIEPDQDGGGQLLPVERANPNTGPTARQLSRITDALPTPTMSPAKIEWTVRNAFGTLGQDALRGIDMLNDARASYPASPRAELPILGRFLSSFPSMSAASVQKFYNYADKIEQVNNTLKKYEAVGDPKTVDFINAHKFEISSAQVVTEARQQISQLRATSDAFAKMPASGLSPQQKRQLIDNNTRLIIQITRNYNTVLATLQAQLK